VNEVEPVAAPALADSEPVVTDALGEPITVDVTPPRALPIVAGLIGLGVLVAILGVVIAFGVASVAPDPRSLTDVEQQFGVDLPDTGVVSSASADSARVTLPAGTVDPLLGSAFAETPDVPSDIVADDLTDTRFYIAIGESVATALEGTDADGNLVLEFALAPQAPVEGSDS
jgi:hypothetical protein